VDPTEDEIFAFLRRARDAVASGTVEVTLKADDELVELGWTREDLFLQLGELSVADFLRAETSAYDDSVRVWVFCPGHWDDSWLWLRLFERGRAAVVAISIHQARGNPWTA